MPQYKELDTLRSFTAKLNIALSTLPVPRLFADLLVQDKLVGEAAARNIVSPTGIDDYNKVSRLMSAVYSYVQTVSSQEKATLIFNKLVIILHNDPLGLEDLAQQLVQHRGEGDPTYKTPLTAEAVATPTVSVPTTTDASPSAPSPSAPVDIMQAKPTLIQLTLLKSKSETGKELERVEIMKEVAAKWKHFGSFLEFDQTGTQLNNLASQYAHASLSPVEPCRAMFMHWLEGNGVKATWEKVLEFLIDIDKKRVAEKIEKILLCL